MVYILTKTFDTATWIYYGRREEGGRLFPSNFKKIEIPTAAAIFPAEMSEWPPRSYVERILISNNGLKCQQEAILLHWKNQIYL